MSALPKPVLHFLNALSYTLSSATAHNQPNQARDFHRQFQRYDPTPLPSFPALAKSLGLGSLYIKDERSRFSLPAFKILGASYAVYRAILPILHLDPSTATLHKVQCTIQDMAYEQRPKIFTASQGNHGRAVAHISNVLATRVTVFLPKVIGSETIERLKSEGKHVVVDTSSENYDVAVAAAAKAARETEGGVLVQDTAFEGYEEVPQWIVEGYGTMMAEIAEELERQGVEGPTHIVVPVGVGSLAQAVVAHYKAAGRVGKTRVIAIEPEGAACLYESLKKGEVTTVEVAGPSILDGMDCGTVSSIAWPLLKKGVSASTTVDAVSADNAVKELKALGFEAGPCGGATFAALKDLVAITGSPLGLDNDAIVVLLCMEGPRHYETPVRRHDTNGVTPRPLSVIDIDT